MATASIAETLETGVSTEYASHWCQDRQSNLIRTNGIQRGSFWRATGIDDVLELGITAPTVAPDIEIDPGVGGANAGNYYCAYRYVDAAGTPSSLGPLTCIVAEADDGFNWKAAAAGVDGIIKPTESRPTAVELWRATADQAITFYKIATLTLSDFTGIPLVYSTDDDSDEDLQASDADDIMPLLNDDRSLHARRFEPPPTDMAVCVAFQDRYWYAVPLSIPGTTMVGVDDWETLVVGRFIYKEGNTRPLQISSAADPLVTLEDDSTQTLNASDVWVDPGPNERNAVFYSYPGEPESVPPSQNVLYFSGNTDDSDPITALIPWGQAMWIMRARHALRYSFAQDPRYDSAWRLIYSRGCLNQRCWGLLDEVCYSIDQMGCWRMTGGGSEPIDTEIQNLFRDGTIDMTKRDKFFVEVDLSEKLVKYHVIYATDTDTRPKRAICYHAPSQSWSTQTYPTEMGGAAKTVVGSRVRSIVGGDAGRVLLASEGSEDPDSTAIAWEWKSGMMQIPASKDYSGQLHIVYPPTTEAETLVMEFYYDHNSSAETFKTPHKEGGASVSAGSTEITVDMQAARSVRGTAPGFDRWPIHVRSDERAISHRFLTIKLSGEQQDEAIAVSRISVGSP